MKKKHLFLLLLLIAVLLCVFFLSYRATWTEKLLIMNDGTVIVAEEFWADGKTVYYRKDDTISPVEKGEVKQIVETKYGILTKLKKVILPGFISAGEILTDLLGLEGLKAYLTAHTIPGRLIMASPFIIILAGAGCLCAILLGIKSTFSKAIKQKNKSKIGTTYTPSVNEPILTNIAAVDDYFLDLFRHQLNAADDCPGRIVSVQDQESGPARVYELQVKHRNESKTRRMTITPLGPGNGNKSQCFYVIYDKHLVVKIPPEPILNLNEYIHQIKQQTEIVNKLAPMECITPNISVILQLAKPIPNAAELSLEALENFYLSLLEDNPKLEKFLKINDTFVFFMDLSKYYFLSQVISGLHNTEKAVRREISVDSDLIFDCSAFSHKYGHHWEALCFDLQKAYTQYEKVLKDQKIMHNIVKDLSEKARKEFFVAHLLGKELKNFYTNLSRNSYAEINRILNNSFLKNETTTRNYRILFKESITHDIFTRNISKTGGIVTNLLKLLSQLGEKNVSMRDLKPDNILVAGNPANYPLFLSSATDYQIGLIDVETSVDYESMEKGEPIQPILGGTPCYATPAHFFKNSLLKEMYDDVGKILHFQDWYAVIAIIFFAITGERLFLRTAHHVHQMVRTLQHENKQQGNLQRFYKDSSCLFWQIASNEFSHKILNYKKQLDSISITIPEYMRQWLHNFLNEKKKDTDNKLAECIYSQDLFKNEKTRQILCRYTYKDIQRIKEKYADPNYEGKLQTEKVNHIRKFFEILTQLKLTQNRVLNHKIVLEKEPPILSAYNVLNFMFDITYMNMYKNEWKTPTREDTRVENREETLPSKISRQGSSLIEYTVTIQIPSQ